MQLDENTILIALVAIDLIQIITFVTVGIRTAKDMDKIQDEIEEQDNRIRRVERKVRGMIRVEKGRQEIRNACLPRGVSEIDIEKVIDREGEEDS